MKRAGLSCTDRRVFLQSAVVGGSALACSLAAPRSRALLAAAGQTLREGTRILFQGDSITDAGRDRKVTEANSTAGLGRGYPSLIAAGLLSERASAKLQILNRGISGNKVPDLASRWQEDAIALKPDILSILIGVNDIWHKLNNRYAGTVEDYATGYRELIERTRTELPGVRVVICEPFVLRCGAVNDQWFPEFDQRRAVAKELASTFQLDFVPFQSMFDDAVEQAPPSYWAADGVHPTLAGHALMARTWRRVVNI